MTRVYIAPRFDGPDNSEGGIRRVVEAQCRYLPEHGIEVVRDPRLADLIAVHAAEWIDAPPSLPVVTHCHGLYWAEYQWDRWCHMLNRDVVGALRRADVVTAPSEWVAQELRRGMWLDPVVLGHGVDADEWTPPADGSGGGYVLWNKTRVDQVCDPTPVTELAARARDVDFVSTFGKATRNVRLTGRLPYERSRSLIQQAGVYLATSRETFGIGTLEAMACGVPILGWAWGGQAEFVRHRESGYLAKVGDYDDLRAGLAYCFAERARLGHSARQDVITYHALPRAMARYAELYKGLLASPSHTQPKISVIVPCYNLGRYLEECVESVVRQERMGEGDVEIIVVDDASTDGSRVVAERLASTYPSRVTVHHHEHNQHVSHSLNTGFGLANGRYILALDPDNRLAPRALATMLAALEGSRDIDIAYGGVQFMRADGVTPNEEVGPDGISGWPPKEFSFQGQMQFPLSLIPSTALCRRAVWERTGGYRERIRNGVEDVDFWCRATSLGFVPRRVTNSPTLIYRMRDDSLSTVRGWQHGKDWTEWYPWAKDRSKLPYAVGHPANRNLRVPITESPPLVSVIIPVGPGHERLVIDALDSLVAQTFERWEAIVVNDTGQPLERLPAWVHVCTTGRPGEGPGMARNVGIAEARADALVFLDADDYLTPTALEKLWAAWGEWGGYVYADWWTVKDDGSQTRREALEWTPTLPLDVDEMPWPISAIYRKEDVVAVGGFSEGVEWEDWDFLLKLHRRGVCGVRYPEPLLYFRLSEGKRHLSVLGEHRVDAYQALRTLWRPYFDREEELMACGCGGNRVMRAPPSGVVVAQNGGGLAEGMVLLEYVGGASSFTVRGPVTGVMYTFKSRRAVYADDVDELLRHPKLRRTEPVPEPQPEPAPRPEPVPV